MLHDVKIRPQCSVGAAGVEGLTTWPVVVINHYERKSRTQTSDNTEG